MMKTYGIAYVGTLISFPLIDTLWLGIVAKNFYRDQLGELMLPSPNLAVNAVSYLLRGGHSCTRGSSRSRR